jgi:hypothetical protein
VHPLGVTTGPAILKSNVAPFNPSNFCKPIAKNGKRFCVTASLSAAPDNTPMSRTLSLCWACTAIGHVLPLHQSMK